MIEFLLALALGVAVPFGLHHGLVAIGARTTNRSAAWLALAAAVGALALPRGPWAAAVALPWLVVTVAAGAAALTTVARRARFGGAAPIAHVGVLIALGFLAVGAAALVLDRGALRPFGFAPTIVLLTAVHFHVAGFVLTLAGSLVAGARPGAGSRLALGALVLGTPLTALGFFAIPAASWIGALLVAAAGIAIGRGEILASRAGVRGGRRARLVAVGGASLFVSMPLAAGYATGAALGLPFLDIPAMAAVHGTLNVIGFAIPSMIGWGGIAR